MTNMKIAAELLQRMTNQPDCREPFVVKGIGVDDFAEIIILVSRLAEETGITISRSIYDYAESSVSILL